MDERTAATVAYLLLVAGVLLRKNRRVHPLLMGAGISIDTALVLILQIQRGVIQEAVTETFTLWQSGHIWSSTIAFALYTPVVVLGIRQVMRKGSATERLWHIRLGITAFVFRSVGFVLMFTIQGS